MSRYLVLRPAPWADPGPITYTTPCLCDQYPGVWEYPAGWAALAMRGGWQLLLVDGDGQAQLRDPRAVLLRSWGRKRGRAHA